MRSPARCFRLRLVLQASMFLATCTGSCLLGQEPEHRTEASKPKCNPITPEESRENLRWFGEMQKQRQARGEPLLTAVDFIELFCTEEQKREIVSPDYARDLNSSEIWAQKKGRSPLI